MKRSFGRGNCPSDGNTLTAAQMGMASDIWYGIPLITNCRLFSLHDIVGDGPGQRQGQSIKRACNGNTNDITRQKEGGMILEKGVCDICGSTFDLENTCYSVKKDWVEDKARVNMSLMAGVKGSLPEGGFIHVCGKTCLVRWVSDGIDELAFWSRYSTAPILTPVM